MVIRSIPKASHHGLRAQDELPTKTERLKHPKPPLPRDGCSAGDRYDRIPPGNTSSATLHQSRVPKADKNGKWLKSFGEPATNPSAQHAASIARTRREHLRRQSRNAPIEVFDSDGKYLRQIKISEPFDYANAAPASQQAASDLIGTMGPALPGRFALRPRLTRCFTLRSFFRPRVQDQPDGKIPRRARQAGNQLKELADSRNCCPSENEIYVANC